MRTIIKLWLLLFFFPNWLWSQTQVVPKKLSRFDSIQRARIERIISNLDAVINSNEFSNQILNYSHNGELTFADSKGDSNAKIYSRIMSGSELLDETVDMKWDLTLSLKWLFSRNTLAYTYFNRSEIYINSRYFNNSLDASVAGTICHEYMHKLGYSHEKVYSQNRPHTVPYAVGYICELLYANIIVSNRIEEQSCGLWCRIKGLLSGRSQ